jgi:glycosyltransferase involved in cell wall biosynthesis
MNNFIEVQGRKIGADYPPFVIAEIGINHEGSLQIAKEMVDAAYRAGAECVKHQTHIVADEMSGDAKKGLSIVLKAWGKIIENRKDVELLIIGTHKEIKGKQITWFERRKNSDLAEYYQATNFYLFSSLCHEGHPLSLTEALKSGAKCLASDIDPISEVLHNGDLGYLVKNPHFIESWTNAIHDVLNNEVNFNKNETDLNKLYDNEKWINSFKEILNKK